MEVTTYDNVSASVNYISVDILTWRKTDLEKVLCVLYFTNEIGLTVR